MSSWNILLLRSNRCNWLHYLSFSR